VNSGAKWSFVRLASWRLHRQEQDHSKSLKRGIDVLQQHQSAFLQTAHELNLIILVRDANAKSERFMDTALQNQFRPKPFDLKAKTADRDPVINGKPHKVAGLVVSFDIFGASAFRPSKVDTAKTEWDNFKKNKGRFDVVEEPKDEYYGCVALDGKNIYADHDLYAVIRPGQERIGANKREVQGQPHHVGLDTKKVQSTVNLKIGIDMVQHSYQTAFFGRDKDDANETIWAFKPKTSPEELRGLDDLNKWLKKQGLENYGKVMLTGHPGGGQGDGIPRLSKNDFRVIRGGKS